MPADPSVAGRKGGSKNTPAQQAARKKNGFQRKITPSELHEIVKAERATTAAPAVLIPAQPKADQ